MANYDVLKVDGSKAGSVELNDSVFAIEPNNDVLLKQLTYNVLHYAKVHTLLRIVQQYVVVDVNHGDKRYRTCASRYNPRPQWRGGGIVFGPTPRSYAYKMPKKMRRLALRSALSFKVQESNLTVVDSFNLDAPKTKEFKTILSNLEQPKKY